MPAKRTLKGRLRNSARREKEEEDEEEYEKEDDEREDSFLTANSDIGDESDQLKAENNVHNKKSSSAEEVNKEIKLFINSFTFIFIYFIFFGLVSFVCILLKIKNKIRERYELY